MTIRGRQTLTIAVVLASILAACTGTQSSPGASQPDGSEPASSGGGTATGGTVRIGLPGYPDSLNPGLAVLAESYTIYELVYDTPVSVTATGEWIPKLATEWSVSEDGLTWTMTLVEGATFHDGEPADADDVAFSVEFYRDNEFPLLTSYAEPFVEVTVVDPVTITLTTEDPMSQPLFEQNMAAIYVLPEHIWANEDPQEFGNEEMIGTGPFTLTEASQGESVELAANPDYWGTPAAIDGVIFQTITNADARITALTTGEIDALTEFPATAHHDARERRERRREQRRDSRRSAARHLLQHHHRGELPCGRGGLLRSSRAEGPGGEAGACPCRGQVADHPGVVAGAGHARTEPRDSGPR